jgi:hypothetical protein
MASSVSGVGGGPNREAGRPAVPGQERSASGPAAAAGSGSGRAGAQAPSAFALHLGRGRGAAPSAPAPTLGGLPGALELGAQRLVLPAGISQADRTHDLVARARRPARDDRDGDGGERGDKDAALVGPTALAPADELDPMARALRLPCGAVSASAAASSSAPSEGHDAVANASRVSLEHVLSRLVRRIAWSGDGQAGSARIEFGAGALEGATLTLHAVGGELHVNLDLPPGVDSAAWKDRIARRLSARGLQVSSLEVS